MMEDSDDEIQTMDTVEGLSSFDLIRPKRSCIPENSFDDSGELIPATITIEIEVGETFCGDEIKCSICLDILEKTWTVTACLHRFCSDCLHKSLRMQLGSERKGHECPLCRAKLASRRSSKPDPNFDHFISILLEKNEAKNEDDDLALPLTALLPLPSNNSSSQEPFNASYFRKIHEVTVQKMKDRQVELKNDIKNNISTAQRYSVTKQSGVNSLTVKKTPEYTLWCLKPLHSLEDTDKDGNDSLLIHKEIDKLNETNILRKPYLTSSSLMAIKDIRAYLYQKLTIFNQISEEYLKHQIIEISAYDNRQLIILDDLVTLKEICLNHWDAQSDLTLYFQLKPRLGLSQ